MSLQPVDVQRIFLRPVCVLPPPVRWFYKVSSVFLQGCPALSGKRGSVFAVCRRDRLVDVSQIPSAGRFIFPVCLRLHLLRGRILTRSGWIFLGHTDVKSGRACGAAVVALNAIQRRSFLRGRSVVDRLTHNQQAAGSSPAPATIFPEWFREPGASERQLARSGEFFYDYGELCRWASRYECAALLALFLVGSIALVALIFLIGGVF